MGGANVDASFLNQYNDLSKTGHPNTRNILFPEKVLSENGMACILATILYRNQTMSQKLTNRLKDTF
jgi:hypothetical protein